MEMREFRESNGDLESWPTGLQGRLEEDVLDLVEQNLKEWGAGIPFRVLVVCLRNRAFVRPYQLKSKRHWVMTRERIGQLEKWLPQRGFTLTQTPKGLELSI